MNTRAERLAARVKARNTVNAYVNRVWPLLAAAFAPFVGQQIFTVKGELLAKVKKALPELPKEVNVIGFRQTSSYNLLWVFTADQPVGNPQGFHTSERETETLYVGKLEHGVLSHIYRTDEIEAHRSDYTVAEVLERREAYDKAKKAVDAAKGALHPFGESE